MGEEFVSQSRALDTTVGPLRVHGLAGLPDAARARADHQYVYVNGRYVRDRLIAHGVRSAYDDVLHGQRQPVYVLFIDIAPDRVDVNVHPTKIEVRFRDSREVHQAGHRAVEQALALPRATLTAAATSAAPVTGNARAPYPEPPRMPMSWQPQRQASLALRDASILFSQEQPSSWRVSEAPAVPAPVAGPVPADDSPAWPLGRAIAQLGGV